MDLSQVKKCPVCNKELISNQSNNYFSFYCSNQSHIKGSLVCIEKQFIYESVIGLIPNNYKLDIRYHDNNKMKIYNIGVYSVNGDKFIKEEKQINKLIPSELFNEFNVNKIYGFCQKILNNLSFI